MTARSGIVLGLATWVGAALLLSDLRWFARRPLVERIRPHLAGGWRRAEAPGVLSVASFRDVVAPLAGTVGERLARLFGVQEDLATRLRRVHSDLDPATVRLRQAGWSAVALVGTTSVVAVGEVPTAPGSLFVVGAPLLSFLLVEQHVTSASARWQERLFLELPVVSEQIAMLLSAGYSLGAALDRVATRGSGACASDLARVGRRIRQGLDEAEALREWAELAGVPAVDRLVGVLVLNRDTGDLGRLLADEARGLRREAQRRLTVQVERRAQQVWIPVTVAALVPGTLFIAVPFLQAMRLFATG